MGKVKQIEIKNQTYYFYNDMINLKNFESNLVIIDKKDYKDIDILDTLYWIHCWIHYPYIGHYIGYITIKKIGDCENNHTVNPLYLLVNHASGNIEEKNGNKYLIFDDSVNENKRLLKICTCLGRH